ncbi:MAG TPA: GNAT family protein [Ignavibacteria bacterium]|nr:GNAT family protein [Ignavibacteria bacterium]
MRTEIVTKEELCKISSWTGADRLEIITCRPVKDGKRIPPSSDYLEFLFYSEISNEPGGKFTLFNFNDRNRSAEFGYIVNPELRNKGIGSEMIRFFLNEIFTKTKFNKLYCQTAAFNTASVKMIEKLGFSKDAVLRENHELDGKFYDDYVYSLLCSDWIQFNLCR